VAGPFRYPVPLAWHGLLWSLDVVVVAACVFGPRQKLPWLEALGNVSYSLYLCHFIVLLVAARMWMKLGYPAPALFPPLAMIAAVAVSLAVYRWVEQPLTASFNRRPGPAPQPA
jgi:peptidoglycan/LPS O-acetylase OafA/YrhL